MTQAEVQNKIQEVMVTQTSSWQEQIIERNKKSWEALLGNDPTLRMRIAGMAWYRDCLTGNMSENVCTDYIKQVQLIEKTINEKKEVFEWVVYQSWWQKYLSGTIAPENVELSYLPAVEKLVDFDKTNPNEYAKISRSSLWSNAQDPNDPESDASVIYQARLIQSIQAIEDAARSQETIKNIFQKYGLKIEALYAMNTIEEFNLYVWKMTAIMEVERAQITDPQRYQRFINSTQGREYREWALDTTKISTLFEGF